MNWNGFLKWFGWSFGGFWVSFVIAICILDPFGNLPFTSPVNYWPIAMNQRYSYPAIARNPDFDSAILGTSTVHLLRPKSFNELMTGRFANLSMSSATAYEQARLFEVFLRHHSEPDKLILGLDIVWCDMGDKLTKYTFRQFPEWMYDNNPWNDFLHFFEVRMIKTLIRKFGTLLGLRKSKFGKDGYYPFLPPASEYNLGEVRKDIYGTTGPHQRKVPATPPPGIEEKRASWTYPSHPLLERLLKNLPNKTKKILFFVPYHRYYQPVANTTYAARWNECKQRITKMARNYSNTVVLDFMIPSPITRRDENYWDVLHYSVDVADRLANLIARGASGKLAPNGEYVVLK